MKKKLEIIIVLLPREENMHYGTYKDMQPSFNTFQSPFNNTLHGVECGESDKIKWLFGEANMKC